MAERKHIKDLKKLLSGGGVSILVRQRSMYHNLRLDELQNNDPMFNYNDALDMFMVVHHGVRGNNAINGICRVASDFVLASPGLASTGDMEWDFEWHGQDFYAYLCDVLDLDCYDEENCENSSSLMAWRRFDAVRECPHVYAMGGQVYYMYKHVKPDYGDKSLPVVLLPNLGIMVNDLPIPFKLALTPGAVVSHQEVVERSDSRIIKQNRDGTRKWYDVANAAVTAIVQPGAIMACAELGHAALVLEVLRGRTDKGRRYLRCAELDQAVSYPTHPALGSDPSSLCINKAPLILAEYPERRGVFFAVNHVFITSLEDEHDLDDPRVVSFPEYVLMTQDIQERIYGHGQRVCPPADVARSPDHVHRDAMELLALDQKFNFEKHGHLITSSKGSVIAARPDWKSYVAQGRRRKRHHQNIYDDNDTHNNSNNNNYTSSSSSSRERKHMLPKNKNYHGETHVAKKQKLPRGQNQHAKGNEKQTNNNNKNINAPLLPANNVALPVPVQENKRKIICKRKALANLHPTSVQSYTIPKPQHLPSSRLRRGHGNDQEVPFGDTVYGLLALSPPASCISVLRQPTPLYRASADDKGPEDPTFFAVDVSTALWYASSKRINHIVEFELKRDVALLDMCHPDANAWVRRHLPRKAAELFDKMVTVRGGDGASTSRNPEAALQPPTCMRQSRGSRDYEFLTLFAPAARELGVDGLVVHGKRSRGSNFHDEVALCDPKETLTKYSNAIRVKS
jgi:hypothetical protein